MAQRSATPWRRAAGCMTLGLTLLGPATGWAWQSPAASSRTPQRAAIRVVAPDKNGEKSPERRPGELASSDASKKPASTKIEASSFKGITPGISSVRDLEAAWGQAKEKIDGDDGDTQLSFDAPPFKSVVASVRQDRVRAIVVTLHKPFTAEGIAQTLGISHFEPAVIPDDTGKPLGMAYPERGVLLSYGDPEQPLVVTQVILEPLSAQTFLLRAEARQATRFQDCLKDVEQALALESKNAHAHWLKAKVLAEAGQLREAIAAGEFAVEQAPDQLEYRLTLGQALAEEGRYARAVEQVQAVSEQAGENQVLRARALNQWATYLGASPERKYKEALQRRLEAIKLADAAIDDPRLDVQRQAMNTLLNANLGIAGDVARGPFTRKPEAVARWLKASQELCEEIVLKDGGEGDHRFRLARLALAALAAIPDGTEDPQAWLELATREGERLVSAAQDPLRKQRFQWDLGIALYDGTQIYFQQKKMPEARKCGEQAVAQFDACREAMQQLPGQGCLLGRLYYRIGASYALESKAFDKAVVWFERAVPLVQQPLPESAQFDVGAQGESLVSMAISYWNTNHRQEAIDLTTQGAELMERAVSEGILDRTALSVPYSNLSVMHRKLGNTSQADELKAQAQAAKESATR